MSEEPKRKAQNAKPFSSANGETGTAYRIPKPVDPRVHALRAFRRKAALVAGVILTVALCLIFPGVMAFVELAAREIRYLWWLIAILALGIWLTFFFGKKKND